MQLTPQTIYYGVAVAVTSGGALWAIGKYILVKPVRYFSRLEFLLTDMGSDVKEIKTNHLPHIYDRLGRLEERIEIREDSSGHSGRS